VKKGRGVNTRIIRLRVAQVSLQIEIREERKWERGEIALFAWCLDWCVHV
jgi:hypothetical protein